MAVPDKPGSLQDVIAMADGINHAIPTQQELRQSFGWLQQHGFIRKDAKTYSLTPSGTAIRNRCSKPTMMKTWDAVTAHFSALPSDDAEPDDVSSADVATAYTKYKKWFWQTYKKLKTNDRNA